MKNCYHYSETIFVPKCDTIKFLIYVDWMTIATFDLGRCILPWFFFTLPHPLHGDWLWVTLLTTTCDVPVTLFIRKFWCMANWMRFISLTIVRSIYTPPRVINGAKYFWRKFSSNYLHTYNIKNILSLQNILF